MRADPPPPQRHDSDPNGIARRDFLKRLGVAALASASLSVHPDPPLLPSRSSAAEAATLDLWHGLSHDQRREICFDWNYVDPQRGLLRSFIANHWQITRPCIRSAFFSRTQQLLIHDIFTSMVQRDWYPRFLQQVREDTGHDWGTDQSIALFGNPDEGKFQFIITGRHMTLRADGHSEGHCALGGPILYGHAAGGFFEDVHHPGNIFWPQAQQANRVFRLLDAHQQQQALVTRRPPEEQIEFRGRMGEQTGLAVVDMSADQKAEVEMLLRSLVAPFREEEHASVRHCLRQQGGLERCRLTFYREEDLGNDGEWDNWRLEGPAFVWYFRGTPHVHVWAHVADNPAVKINSRTGAFLHPEHDRLDKLPVGVPPPGTSGG